MGEELKQKVTLATLTPSIVSSKHFLNLTSSYTGILNTLKVKSLGVKLSKINIKFSYTVRLVYGGGGGEEGGLLL